MKKRNKRKQKHTQRSRLETAALTPAEAVTEAQDLPAVSAESPAPEAAEAPVEAAAEKEAAVEAVEAPMEAEPVEKPIEALAEDEPAEEPAEVPAEDEPAGESVEAPTENESTEESAEASAEEEPAEEAVEAPAEEEPAEEAAEAPAEDESTEELVEAPAEDEPAEEPAEAPVEDEPTEESVEAPVEDAPAEESVEAPVEDEPAEEAEEVPAEEESTEEAEEAPVEDESVEESVEAPTENESVEESVEAPTEEEPTGKAVEASAEEAEDTGEEPTRAFPAISSADEEEDVKVFGEEAAIPSAEEAGNTIRMEAVNPELSDTRPLDKGALHKLAEGWAMADTTQEFTPVTEEPPQAPDEQKAEPFSEDWEPEYDAPIGEYFPPQPIVFQPRSRIQELKQKLVAGPEHRYYELMEQGLSGLQAAIFLSALVVLLACGSLIVYALDLVPPERMRLMVFGQVLSMLLESVSEGIFCSEVGLI